MKRTSIRKKILLPFVCIISVMTVCSILSSVYFFSDARPFIFGSVLVLVLVNVLIFGIYSAIIRKITNSLEMLSSMAQEVSKGDLNQKIDINSADEIGDLSEIFNQMVKNLRESASNLLLEKKRSEAIIASIPEGLIVTDMENRLILSNHMGETLLQYSIDYLTHESIIKALVQNNNEERKSITREISIPNPGGKDRFYSVSSSLVSNKKKEYIGVITIVRDITHERELEELREGFLRTVTHELRTPLTSIIGFIELIYHSEDPQLTDQKRQFLKIALTEASSLKNMIDDLLDLSKMRAGMVKTMPASILVKEVIESVASTFLPLAKGKNLEIHVTPVQSQLEVKADGPKLRRILINLVSNALKFTQEGSITLSCYQQENAVVFSVSDTGIGLLEEERDVIFEKFRQIDYSTTRKYEGIGLGLYIVKQLVEMHGGKVWVESDYGKGSTFFFSIPL